MAVADHGSDVLGSVEKEAGLSLQDHSCLGAWEAPSAPPTADRAPGTLCTILAAFP